MKNIKQLICFLILSFLINESQAQQVQELGNKLLVMRGSSDAAVKNEADRLSSLAYDSNPTLYIDNGKLVKVGEQLPVRLIADASSIQLLRTSNSLYNRVELICLKIEKADDLNAILKLSDLSGFPKLKYIFFQCSFQLCADQSGKGECEAGKISNMLQGNDSSGLKIFYTINIDN